DVRATYRSADTYRHLTIFDIGGNNFRLIAFIDYEYGKLFIRNVLTHAEYDRDAWKDDLFGSKPRTRRKNNEGSGQQIRGTDPTVPAPSPPIRKRPRPRRR